MDAEVGLGLGVDAEESGDGWGKCGAVEDLWVAEDVHEEGVGGVGAVEFAPVPVGAGAVAAMGGVDLGEAAGPVGVGEDGGVAGGVEVAVGVVLVATEEDAGVGAGGLVVQEGVGVGGDVVARACVEVVAEGSGGPVGIGSGWHGCLSSLDGGKS